MTLVRIEKGEQSPRYETLVALALALGLPLAELLLADPGPRAAAGRTNLVSGPVES